MIDGWARRKIDPWITGLARPLAALGISPDAITIAGCLIGLAAAAAIAAQAFATAVALILLSRLCDGLDGAVARLRGKVSDLGGYLDIVLDFFFYGAIPLAFAIAEPETNALAAAALLFSFYVNGATFLAYAAIAARRGWKSEVRGPKSLYFTAGIAEAGETLAFFIAFCIMPQWFPQLALAFAILCMITASARILQAIREVRPGARQQNFADADPGGPASANGRKTDRQG